MNKQKKELRQRQSTRQLMGISQLTQHGIRTSEGELVFYLIKPDNLSVLSEDGIRGRVMALTRLLCTMSQVQMLALDSRESFRRNKDWYRLRMEQEDLPAIRELLRQDSVHLDDIQAGTASAREFAIVLCPERGGGEPDENHLRQTEKRIRDLGFQVRLADPQDIKRLLAVYYQQDVTTNVCTTENDDWLNIYANYDMDEQAVCDTLDVYLVLANGDEQAFKYQLSPEEQALLLPKMEEYCLNQTGMGLAEYSTQVMAEGLEPPTGPTM